MAVVGEMHMGKGREKEIKGKVVVHPACEAAPVTHEMTRTCPSVRVG